MSCCEEFEGWKSASSLWLLQKTTELILCGSTDQKNDRVHSLCVDRSEKNKVSINSACVKEREMWLCGPVRVLGLSPPPPEPDLAWSCQSGCEDMLLPSPYSGELETVIPDRFSRCCNGLVKFFFVFLRPCLVGVRTCSLYDHDFIEMRSP